MYSIVFSGKTNGVFAVFRFQCQLRVYKTNAFRFSDFSIVVRLRVYKTNLFLLLILLLFYDYRSIKPMDSSSKESFIRS